MNYTPILVVKSDDSIDFVELDDYCNLKDYFRNSKRPFINGDIIYSMSWYKIGNKDINKVGTLLIEKVPEETEENYAICGSVAFHKYKGNDLTDFNNDDIEYLFNTAKKINEKNKRRVMNFDEVPTIENKENTITKNNKINVVLKRKLSNLLNIKKNKN